MKKTCPEMLKNFLKDKILTEKEYKYLYKNVYDFYGINLSDFFTDREGNNPRIVEILTEQLYVKTQMFYRWSGFMFIITGKGNSLLHVHTNRGDCHRTGGKTSRAGANRATQQAA